MATWVTHLMMVDKMYEMGLALDEVGFCVGNVGPDCNVENADWTEFTPSREVTHWMSKECDKLTTDYDGFAEKYILGKKDIPKQEYAFLIGYYSHLLADIETQRFIRNEARVAALFDRIKKNPAMYEKMNGQEETFDNVKKTFGGGQKLAMDLIYLERDYLNEHSESKFETVLRKTKSFPDYLDYFPKGAFTRKLAIIDQEYDFGDLEKTPEVLYFYAKEEFMAYVEQTSNMIYEKLQRFL